MGGTSTTQNQATQASTTGVGAAAQPAYTGMLGQVTSNLNNTGVTGTENGALDTLENNGNAASATYAPSIADFAKSLLAGGGATNQDGTINQNYLNYAKVMNPIATNTNYDPMQTPGLGTTLQTIQSDVANNVNGMFAGAGRDLSGANQQAYGRGVAAGESPIITAQYDANVANQTGAAKDLFNAGTTTTGELNASNTQGNVNRGQGVTAAGAATDMANTGANAALAAEAARRGIPVQALGLLAQIGVPLAGMTTQSTGNTTSNGSSTMSGAQQFGTIASGIGSMIPKGPMSFSF